MSNRVTTPLRTLIVEEGAYSLHKEESEDASSALYEQGCSQHEAEEALASSDLVRAPTRH